MRRISTSDLIYARVLLEENVPFESARSMHRIFQTNDRLVEVLESPIVDAQAKYNIIDKVFDKPVCNFLKVAVNNGMIDYAVKKCGKLDVLVNNAGIMDEFTPIGELTNELFNKVMAVNLNGPIYAMRKAVQVMLEQETKGNIVNIASIGGVCGARAGVAYTASKHAIVGATKNTAYMYAGKIRCNVVCPGGVETEVMNSQTNISQFGVGRIMAGLDTSIPAGKVEDISTAVLYIASDDAKFMTGAEIVIDGGVSCN